MSNRSGDIDNFTFTISPQRRLLDPTRKHAKGTTEWIRLPQLLTAAADQLCPVSVAPLL